MVAVPTILLSTSCSNLLSKNEIALKCRGDLKLKTSLNYPDAKELAMNGRFDEIYLINPKDKKVQLYTDTSITEQEDVYFAPKSINFKKPEDDLEAGSIRYWIDRETLKVKILGIIITFDSRHSVSGEGICKKIPYPSMVSTKNKI